MSRSENVIKKKIRKSVSCEQGFTLIELLIVIVIIGIMLGVSVVAYVTSMGNADARGAAEMLKQDLRRVYALAASGEKPTGIDYRYRYSITFNGSSGSPPNSYAITKWTPDASMNYTPTVMTPNKSAANKTEGNYIQPGNESGTTIDYGSSQTIYFVSLGAITLANTDGGTSPGADMQVFIKNGSTTRTINVGGYGNISE